MKKMMLCGFHNVPVCGAVGTLKRIETDLIVARCFIKLQKRLHLPIMRPKLQKTWDHVRH